MDETPKTPPPRSRLIGCLRWTVRFGFLGSVFAIGAANRKRGSSPTKCSLLWRSWRATNALVATYPLAD